MLYQYINLGEQSFNFSYLTQIFRLILRIHLHTLLTIQLNVVY